MAAEKKVVDASVAVKWFLTETGSDTACKLREEHTEGKCLLIAPDLLLAEVANALRYKKGSAADIRAAMTAIELFQIKLERITSILVREAVDLALKYDLSVYDGVYAALSKRTMSPLLTADKALVKLPNTVLVQ